MQNHNEKPLVEGADENYQDPVFLAMYETKVAAMMKKGKNIPWTHNEMALLPKRGFVRTAVFQTRSFDAKGSKYIPRHRDPAIYNPPKTIKPKVDITEEQVKESLREFVDQNVKED